MLSLAPATYGAGAMNRSGMHPSRASIDEHKKRELGTSYLCRELHVGQQLITDTQPTNRQHLAPITDDKSSDLSSKHSSDSSDTVCPSWQSHTCESRLQPIRMAGFERQAHIVREFCLKQGFTLAGEFGRYGQAQIRNDQFSVSFSQAFRRTQLAMSSSSHRTA